MSLSTLEPRVIKRFNFVGLQTLVKREVGRFLSVYTQTIVAPVVTTLLFYAVFALAFGGVAREVEGVPFLRFLAPGLIMMTMVQNAFANTSSSIMISKVQGNIVDVLMPPLSSFELMSGYIVGSTFRGLVVGLVTGIVMNVFVPLEVVSFGVVFLYAFLGNMMLGALGLVAGIWSEKFDHIAAVTNFIVTPMTFLSGTFYAMESLPLMWQSFVSYNPFFYMIDGFRSGFIGSTDGSAYFGAVLLVGVNMFLLGLIWVMFEKGYKIKS